MENQRKLEWKLDKDFVNGQAVVRVNSDRQDPDRPYFSVEVGRMYKDQYSRYLRPEYVRDNPDNPSEITGVVCEGNKYAKLIDEASIYVQTELLVALGRRKLVDREKKEKEIAKRRRHETNLQRRREEDRARSASRGAR